MQTDNQSHEQSHRQNNEWKKLAEYNTNLLAEAHAIFLRNNGINVSEQVLSFIPGMNSGSVLWVAPEQYQQAVDLLNQIDTNGVDDDDDNDNQADED